MFFLHPSQNTHPFYLFPFCVWNQGRQEYSYLIISTLNFPSSCFAWIAVGCLKCFWRRLVILERCVRVWSPRRRMCVQACSLWNDETRCIYAYVCSSLRQRAHVFYASYQTPLLLTPIIKLRFNPSTSLRFPSFLPAVSSGDETYATTPLCTYSTGNTEDIRQRLSWFCREWGETKRSPGAVSQVQKPAEKKVNMDYCTAWGCVGSRHRNNTLESWCEMNGCGKVQLQITFWICFYFKL